MYIEKSLKDYVNLTSEKLPAPGGGSVLALVSSLANGLVEMALNFSRDKEAYQELDLEVRRDLDQSLKLVKMYRKRLMDLVDLDTQAFNKVLEAYKLEKGSRQRAQALDQGYRQALEVPLLCFRYSLESLRLHYLLVGHVEKNIISDLAIGSILSLGALEGSIYNIRANLAPIKDEDFKLAIGLECDQGLEMGQEYREKIRLEVDRKLGQA